MFGCRKKVILAHALFLIALFVPAFAAKETLYTGEVYSAFIHPLIVYPEKAFKEGEYRSYFEDWFVTVEEFRAILPQLYERSFILVKPSDMYGYNTQTGTIEKKSLYLPEGKIPLLFSADDLNYYDTMKNGGTNHRLFVSENGILLAEVSGLAGEKKFSRETEFIFILDDFVALHPDFSFNGAKGVIAFTGYNGIFGYTNTKDPTAADYAQQVREAKKVAEALKKNGWEFASHGYAHLDSAKINAKQLEDDCRLWQKTVEPIVGKTSLFIFPKGSEPHNKPENMRVLLNAGFNFFFGVGEGIYNKWNGNYLLVRRREFDGIYFRSKDIQTSPFFDVTKVTKRYNK